MLSYEHFSKRKDDFIVIFLLFLFSILILWNPNWLFDIQFADDYQFVSTTAVGRPSHAWTGEGRFWPLGLCDYSILLLFPYGTTVTAHYLYNCVIMFISTMLFFHSLKKSLHGNNHIALFCVLLLFSISSFILIHISCIYPEREFFFMFSVFLYFYSKAKESLKNKLLFSGISFIAAVYSTYLKEPIFGIWFLFSVCNLFFGSKKERGINCALLVNSIVWIAIYVYRTLFRDRTLLIEGSRRYGDVSFSIFDNLSDVTTILNSEPILYALLLVFLVRVFTIFRNQEKYNSVIDPSLVAGMGYMCACIILRFKCGYYYFPAVLMGLPGFGLVLSEAYGKSNNGEKVHDGLKYMRYGFILSVLLTSVYSGYRSFIFVQNILCHRYQDPLMFSSLINEHDAGKRIFWVTEKGKEQIIRANSREIDHMKFRRYKVFLDYYAGKSVPFVKTSDYSEIDRDTIVICSDITLHSAYGKEIVSKLEQIGMRLFHENTELGTKMFKYK